MQETGPANVASSIANKQINRLGLIERGGRDPLDFNAMGAKKIITFF